MGKVIGNTTATTMPPQDTYTKLVANNMFATKSELYSLSDIVDTANSTAQIANTNANEGIEQADRAYYLAYQFDYQIYDVIKPELRTKADKTTVAESTNAAYTFEFSATDNKEVRLAEATSISFTFGNGEYSDTYTSGLSFNSGATPTAIDYTDSGILNWVGTDCTTVDGLSIFQPSANTHYDIVFYFNGSQFIGLVNGFVPSVSR